MLLCSDSERRVSASCCGIISSSISNQNTASATTIFFPGR
jgi:hypothetical protein